MATISLTIPDEILSRVINSVAYNNGYTDTVPDGNGNVIPNPITKNQWAKNVLKSWIKANVISYESTLAADLARQTAVDDANTDIVIGD